VIGDSQPDMAQAMHLISGETLQRQTTAKNGNLDRWLVDSSLGNEDVVHRTFLSALVREPNSRETVERILNSSLCGVRELGATTFQKGIQRLTRFGMEWQVRGEEQAKAPQPEERKKHYKDSSKASTESHAVPASFMPISSGAICG
jgi:hypothetical protein